MRELIDRLEREHTLKKEEWTALISEKADKDYLISWDRAVTDTPILDIIHFYRKEFYKIEASSILEEYLDSMSLNADEKKLLLEFNIKI